MDEQLTQYKNDGCSNFNQNFQSIFVLYKNYSEDTGSIPLQCELDFYLQNELWVYFIAVYYIWLEFIELVHICVYKYRMDALDTSQL